MDRILFTQLLFNVQHYTTSIQSVTCIDVFTIQGAMFNELHSSIKLKLYCDLPIYRPCVSFSVSKWQFITINDSEQNREYSLIFHYIQWSNKASYLVHFISLFAVHTYLFLIIFIYPDIFSYLGNHKHLTNWLVNGLQYQNTITLLDNKNNL